MAIHEFERPYDAGKRILVTGAQGFVGRHVARFYAQRGCSVHGIGHGAWDSSDWSAWGLMSWDESDVTLESLRRQTAPPDVILHCAGTGSVGFAIANPMAALERTVISTAHVLEYIRLHAPDCVVVYPSSASVYGNSDTVPIAEDSPLKPISQYGTHKAMVEQMMLSFCRQFGTRAAIVRFFSLYGIGLRKQLLWDACPKLYRGDAVFMGTGDEVRDWLPIEEAAKLMGQATERASSGCPIVNGGSGSGVTVRDVLECLASALGARSPVRFNGEQREGDPVRYVADVRRAKEWGWQPARAWEEGIRDYAAWWLRNMP